MGEAARRVALTRRHPLSQRKMMVAEPRPHVVQSRVEAHSFVKVDSDRPAVATRDVALSEGSHVKGSFTCWTTAKELGGETGTSACRPSQPPAAVSRENGTRNFREAASHNPYRA